MLFREYQEKLISALRASFRAGTKRAILCAPTGAGKTIMFSFMAKEHAAKGGKVLVITHRGELLTQASEELGATQVIDAKTKKVHNDAAITVAMVETLHKRQSLLSDFINSRTLIICDEAHLENFTKVFPLISESAYVIGATATPYRKANQNCLSEFYQSLIQEIDTPELIALGYLSKAITYAVDIDLSGAKKSGTDYDTSKIYTENKTYVGVVNNYLKYSNGKALLFASNVENSIQVCNELLSAGIAAKHVDGGYSLEARESIFNWFRDTEKGVLCNCGIATTGYNQPDIDTIILYRATTSLPLFLQMCGRGSRVTATKKEFKILDFGNNVRRLGFWEQPRIWSLFKQPKRTKNELPAPMTECDTCGALYYLAAPFCPYCGEVKKKFTSVESVILKRLEYKERDAVIRELASALKDKRVKYKVAVKKLKTKEEFELFANCMGYKRGWVWNQREAYNAK